MNDLPNISNRIHTTLFADDTTVCLSDENFYDLMLSCNHELEKIYNWTLCNRLTLNIEKTCYMLVSTRKIPANLPMLVINDSPIALKTEVKFLGVVLDSKLKFDSHIKYISGKVSKSVGVMYRVRDFLPKSCLFSLYYALVYSYLSYCILIWGGTFPTHLKPLLVLQKRVIRTIHHSNYRDHTHGLFMSSGILKLPDIFKLVLGCYIYERRGDNRFLRGHNHETRGRSNMLPTYHRLSVSQKSLFYAGPTLWNSIPDFAKNSRTTREFRNKFKKSLISGYYESN